MISCSGMIGISMLDLVLVDWHPLLDCFVLEDLCDCNVGDDCDDEG